MKSRKQIRQKLEQFYFDIRGKRKGNKMKLQVDQEFQQVKIMDLNDLNNVEMFSTPTRGAKAFAAEQKIRELKTRIAKLANQKLKISPKKIIELSTTNMNTQPSKKFYKQSVQNISCFNKDSAFTIRKKQKIDGIMYYWIKSIGKKLSTRFQRSEIFAIKSNFL